MTGINIVKVIYSNYCYKIDKLNYPKELLPFEFAKCSNCHNNIDPSYAYIIKSLQDSNLLSKYFKTLCCICYSIKKHLGFCRCPKCDVSLHRRFSDHSQEYVSFFCPICKEIYDTVKSEDL